MSKCKNEQLLKDFRWLQTSDHFYYMCTKWFSDGDVHKYFNPYDSPYEAYINFMNALSDFIIRINNSACSGIKLIEPFIPNDVSKDDLTSMIKHYESFVKKLKEIKKEK